MGTVTAPSAARANPYAPLAPGAPIPVSATPPPRPDAKGHWVWVDGPRQWAGLDIPLVRDPIIWVWIFFMTTTTATTVITQVDTDKMLSILIVSWVGVSVVYWFVPAVARQLWRIRQARRRLTVTHHPGSGS